MAEDTSQAKVSRVELDLGLIARKIGQDWRTLGYMLGYGSAQLDHLQEIYHQNPVQRHRTMLEKWWRVMVSHIGDEYKVQQILAKLLQECELSDVAHTISTDYQDVFPPSQMETLVREICFDINHQQEQLDHFVNVRKEYDEKYFETKYFSKSEEDLQKYGCITLVAPPGDGKTMTAMHLALKLVTKFGYCVIPVNKAAELENCNPDKKVVYVLDDPIGTCMVEDQSIQEFLRIRHRVEGCIKKGKTKMIVTMRKQLYNEAEHLIRKSFLGEHVVDISSYELRLTWEEKHGIMKNHKLPQHLIDNLANTDYYPGFPVQCYLLSLSHTNDVDLRLGPVKILEQQIEDIFKTCNIKYCALCLLALYDGIMDYDILVDIDEQDPLVVVKINAVTSSCGLQPSPTIFFKIRNAVDLLVNCYVVRDQNGNVRFLHDCIFDAVAFHYGVKNIPIIIKHFSPSFLRSRVRPKSDIMLECTGNILLPNNKLDMFADRLTRDLQNGYITDVLMNPSVLKTDFQSHWKRCLNNLSEVEKRKLLMSQPKDSGVEGKSMEIALDFAILSSTPIHWFSRLGMWEFMRDVLGDSSDNFLESLPSNTQPLHFAAGYGHLDTVRFLVRSGADVNAKSSLQIDESLKSIGEYYTGFTPLFYACRENHLSVVEYLLQNSANPDLVREHGASPMLLTADRGHHLVIKKLLQYKAGPNICCEHGTSPLLLAAQEGHSQAVKVLVDGGAHINHQKPNGASPLGMAAKNGHTDTVLCLLHRGADINICDINGNTALHLAVHQGKQEVVEVLLKRGADPLVKNINGDSPQYMAVVREGTPLVKTLHGIPVKRI